MERFNTDEMYKISTKRGKPKLLYKGYAYVCKRTASDKIVWVCKYKGCFGHLHTTISLAIISCAVHTHCPDFEKNRSEYLMNNIIQRASTTSESPRDIIYSSLSTYSTSDLKCLPIDSSIVDRIKRNRNTKHQLPVSVQSDIPASIKNLATGELFLQHDSGISDPNRIVVFCESDNFIHIENSDTILMDGTFKSSPCGFKQLYTIIIYKNTKYIPMIFVLMKSKTEICYKQLCNFLTERIPNFKPKNIILDFEAAPKNAFKIFYTEATYYGCLFHFSQNIWRKIQDLGLSKIYKDTSSFRENIRYILSLAFVAPADVSTYYDHIVCKIGNAANENVYSDFLAYFRKNYIMLNYADLLFWNVYQRVIENIPRTTNSLEGYHRALNNLFIRAKPDLGLFGEELIKINFASRRKLIESLYDKSTNTKQNRSDEILRDVVLRYNTLNALDYLKLINMTYNWSMQ